MNRLGASCLLVACLAGPARAQSVAIEGTHSAGVSTEEVGALGTQVRVSGEAGETLRGLRYQIEASWGWRSEEEGDFFGTAYPYGGKLDLMETYAEYPRDRGWVRSVKAGRYRTPFGISSASDHAYIGFMRAPLIRYGEYYALSNTYLEHGADVVIGASRFTVEASLSKPADVGEAIRRDGVTGVFRAQAAVGSFVIGSSYIDTTPYLPDTFAKGRTRFGGMDVRWMSGGVMLRGEWIGGRPFDGTSTTGGYTDVIVHRPVMGPVTAFGRDRASRIRFDPAVRSLYAPLHRRRPRPGVAHHVGLGRAGASGWPADAGQAHRSRRRHHRFMAEKLLSARRPRSQPRRCHGTAAWRLRVALLLGLLVAGVLVAVLTSTNRDRVA